MNIRQLPYLLILPFIIMAAASCATTENVTDEEQPTVELEPLEEGKSESEIQQILASTRSRLSDVYQTQDHDMPEPFLKISEASNVDRDPFDGYRIQIISTRNVDLADSISTQFRMWADTTIAGYSPKTYVSFRQPFFKVHVGDFQDRSMADQLSRLIKKKYPDAWVVHDRIDPKLVPADTIQISFVKIEEKADTLDQQQ